MDEPNELPVASKSKRWMNALFLVACVIVAMYAVGQRASFASRIEGLIIADEAEYLMMAQSLRVPGDLPVIPKRPWGLPLLQAPLLKTSLVNTTDEFDANPARVISLIALLLSALGAAALAHHAAGRWAALGAFAIVSMQPDLGFWSQTFLTDVPFCALAVLSLVLWNREKNFAAGVVLGTGLLFRYSALLFLGAFVLSALFGKRRKSLLPFLAGWIPPLVLLGVLDAIYWGQAFQSVLAFTRDQAGSFLPEWLVNFTKTEDAIASSERILAAPRVWYKRPFLWYGTQLPKLLTWPGLVLLVLYPLARRGMKHAKQLDFLLLISLVYFVALTLLRSKESRYLLPAIPLLAVVAAAVLARLGALALRGGPRWSQVARGLIVAALVTLGFDQYVDASRAAQERRPHRPHGAVIDALPGRFSGERGIAVDEPWKLSSALQIRGAWGRAWIGSRFGIVHAGDLFTDLGDDSPREIRDEAYKLLLRTDLWILPRTWRYVDNYKLWKYINRYCVMDSVVYDEAENDYPVLCFRPVGEGVEEPSLWKVREREEEPPIARFAGGLELLDIRVSRPNPRSQQTRIDYDWFVPESFEGAALAAVSIEHWFENPKIPFNERAKDSFEVLPEDGPRRKERLGKVVTESRYFLLLVEPLRFRIQVSRGSWFEYKPFAVEWTDQIPDGVDSVMIQR